MKLTRLSPLLVAALGWHCGSAADELEVTADAAASAELSARAPGITVYLRPELAASSAGAVTLAGRASKNLSAVRAAIHGAPLGAVRLTSARRFELVVSDTSEVARLLSGAPIDLELDASAGNERAYRARFDLQVQLADFRGPRGVFVESALAPVWLGGALVHRGHFRLSDNQDAARARVEVDDVGPVAVAPETTRRFRFDLTTEALLAALDETTDRVRVSASGTKVATLHLRPRGLEVRVASAPFPASACREDTRACLDTLSTPDAEACGTYAAVALCRAAPSTCAPEVAGALTSCVYNTLESFQSDPEAQWLDAITALDFCTNEGDLFGPLFDELCASQPGAPGCACFGAEGCLEAFVTGPLQACAAEVYPRFDCALGLRYADLKQLPTVYVADARTLTRADVTPGLEATQLLAMLQGAYPDVTDLDSGFSSVDAGQVNRLDLWEGSNGVAYTAFEYGAGDNSYGTIYIYGTTQVAAQIVDGDLYDAADRLGCHIPSGRRWTSCTQSAQCEAAQRCEGVVRTWDEATGVDVITHPGKCVAQVEDAAPQSGDPCGPTASCPLDAGLACSDLGASAGFGSCRPAWMFGRFAFSRSIELPADGLAEHPIVVSGLATVPEAARFEAWLSFPDLSRVKLSLANPTYHTTSVIFDGPTLGAQGVRARFGTTSGEVRLEVPVPVPGDEGVNGEWLLLVDTTAVRTPRAGDRRLIEARLVLSSRYD